VTCYKANTIPNKIGKNITLLEADPTSYAKLSRIMNDVKFSEIFIIIEELEDVRYVLKNIELINSKIRIVLLHQWDDSNAIEEEYDNLTILYREELLATHLYNQLPNVPLVAQNIGLGRGEIMEVHVPFGSAYAYRHVGSIVQRKWKIAVVYRDEKQILPTNATMIRPNDTLLILGKPVVLDGVYKTINKRMGLFPEPFGKDVYLILDFRHDSKNVITYLSEALYLLDKLENKSLFVRIIYPNDFMLLEELKRYDSKQVTIAISYQNEEVQRLIEFDIHEHNIGLVMGSIPAFEADNLKHTLYDLKKLVYLFGDNTLMGSTSSIILMNDKGKMESISSTAFDISEKLGLKLALCDFNPEGDFQNKDMIIEHYETLAQILNIEIRIEQKIANPIREIAQINHVLHIIPFEKCLNSNKWKKLISSKMQDFILTTHKHPKLLVPFAII